MDPITLKTLQSAVKGLLYPSEQDKPVRAVYWPKADIGDSPLDPKLIQKQANLPPGTKTGTQTVADFFAPVTAEQSWQSDTEKANTQRFQALQALLQPLADLQVVRLGETDITVYVLGRTPEGDIAGIITQVVET